MKRIITSAGLAALGAATVHAAEMRSPENSKPWSVSATLRGFYDDNYATSPTPRRQGTFGFEVSPSGHLSLLLDQTTLALDYTYDMRYYADRSSPKEDHSHNASVKLSHAFSPRHKLDVSDNFVIAQEPTVLDPVGAVASPLRSDGDNMRNTANINFAAGLTEQLGLVVGYNNNWFDYDQTLSSSSPGLRSALLDRMEHLGMINGRWTIVPSTIGVLGYQYGVTEYTSKDPLDGPGGVIQPNTRDNTSHYVYAGVDHTFNPKLNASVRAGVQFTEYNNSATASDQTNPYVDANATYTYTVGSYAQLGVRHARNATDIGYNAGLAALAATNPTQDAESTTIYGSINHQIFPKLVASLIGQFQNSAFESGAANSLEDNYFLAGLNINYEINKFLSAEAGYNYDRLDSDLSQIGVARSYTRNRVYIGIRASY